MLSLWLRDAMPTKDKSNGKDLTFKCPKCGKVHRVVVSDDHVITVVTDPEGAGDGEED